MGKIKGTGRWAHAMARLGYGVALLGSLPVGAKIADDAVHPAWEVKVVPMPAMYATMGLGFLPSGEMVVATGYVEDDRTTAGDESSVYVVSGVTDPAMDKIKAVKVGTRYINPSGVVIVGSTIYVADRDAFYQVLDNASTNATANRKKILAWPWGMKWHQWVFTPMYKGGKFYAPYSGSIRGGGPSEADPTSEYSGAFLEWDLQGTLGKFAGGLRSPNGSNIDPDGNMFVADNQGSWLPSSTFAHIKQGKFYGHRQNPPFKPNFAESLPYQPPTAWLPHGVVRSSPGQPIYIPQGTYKGQWLQGDCNGRGLLRIALDNVDGDFQGAVFWFTNGMANSAINRLAWGPDGSLFVATVEKMGNWPGNGLMPIYRMSPKAGGKAFEMFAIRATKDGFEVEFTEAVDKATVNAAAFAIKQWQYVRQEGYGEGKGPEQARTVSGATVSADGKVVTIKVDGLLADRLIYFKLGAIKSAAGGTLWDNEAWYTLNKIPTSTAIAARRATGEPDWAGRVKHGRNPDRSLWADVGLEGDYSVSLRSMAGAEIQGAQGRGPGRFRLEPVRPGIYLLEVARKGSKVVRKVAL